MATNKVKLWGTILRGVAVLLLLLGFLFLLIEGTVETKESVWAISVSNGERVDLDSEYSYGSENFFGRMRRLEYIGFSVLLEKIAIAAFALGLCYMVASIFVKFLKKIYFCAIPLSVVGLLIAILIENDTLYSVPNLSDSLGHVYGYNVFSNTTIEFDLVLIPSIVCVFLAFALMLAASVLEMVAKKRLGSERCDQNITVAPVNEANGLEVVEKATTVQNCETTVLAEDLKKFKDLLDAGIITQEEFEAKKKQILGL